MAYTAATIETANGSLHSIHGTHHHVVELGGVAPAPLMYAHVVVVTSLPKYDSNCSGRQDRHLCRIDFRALPKRMSGYRFLPVSTHLKRTSLPFVPTLNRTSDPRFGGFYLDGVAVCCCYRATRFCYGLVCYSSLPPNTCFVCVRLHLHLRLWQCVNIIRSDTIARPLMHQERALLSTHGIV